MRSSDRYAHSDADGHRTARSLFDRWNDAKTLLAETTETLRKLEVKIPETMLSAWRAAEGVWLAKVVDISNHNDLDNPYSPPAEAGELG